MIEEGYNKENFLFLNICGVTMIICMNCINEYQECNCGGLFIEEIDDNIAEIILKLNRKGYQTKYCCGGHAENEPILGGIMIYINFKRKYSFSSPPNGFKMTCNRDPEHISYSTFTKKEKKLLGGEEIESVIQRKLIALNEWVDHLPDGPDKPPYNYRWNDEYSRQQHIERVLYEESISRRGEHMHEEQHECDLFLMSTHSQYQADNSLYNFAQLGVRNVNGWGIGFFRNGISSIIKSKIPAVGNNNVDTTFIKVSEAVSSNIILGHLRLSSRGDDKVENNHPFSLHFLGYDWLFIHNGSVTRGLELIPSDRQLIHRSNNDSPRVFEFIREQMITYMMADPKKSLMLACKKAYSKLLDTDPTGTYNIILSNGYLSFVFIHWRPFYMLHREKNTGDTALVTTLQLNQEEDWVEIRKASGNRAKMLTYSGHTLLMNGDIK